MKRPHLLPRSVIVLCAGLLALAVLLAQLALLSGGLPTPTVSLPGLDAPALHAGLTRLFSLVSGVLGTPAAWLVDTLGLQASTVRTLQQTGLVAGLWVALLGLVLLLVLHRRSRRAYAFLALSVIVTMLGTPLLPGPAGIRLPATDRPASGSAHRVHDAPHDVAGG